MLRDGVPVVGGRIGLQGGDSAASYSLLTDLEGVFQFEDLPQGGYRLEVLGPRGEVEHREEIHFDGDREILVELASITLTGTVVDDALNPVSGAVVTLGRAMPDQSERRTTTDARGFFQFLRVAPGDWRVVAEQAERGRAERVVEVDGDSENGNLVLELVGEAGGR